MKSFAAALAVLALFLSASWGILSWAQDVPGESLSRYTVQCSPVCSAQPVPGAYWYACTRNGWLLLYSEGPAIRKIIMRRYGTGHLLGPFSPRAALLAPGLVQPSCTNGAINP